DYNTRVIHRIYCASRRMMGEPLIVVVMAVEHELGPSVVQVLPEVLSLRVDLDRAGAEERVVPIRQGARHRVSREIGAQPLLLGRPDPVRHAAVQCDDVPGTDVIAVVALGRVASRSAEVPEVAGGAGGAVVVV